MSSKCISDFVLYFYQVLLFVLRAQSSKRRVQPVDFEKCRTKLTKCNKLQKCVKEVDPVCGTDSHTYINKCQLQIATCLWVLYFPVLDFDKTGRAEKQKNFSKGDERCYILFVLGFCILFCALSSFLKEPSLATILQGIYFIFYIFLPLHVPALVGHLQAEYTTILGSYFSYNESVVLCY
jgi:hypothetical protein